MLAQARHVCERVFGKRTGNQHGNCDLPPIFSPDCSVFIAAWMPEHKHLDQGLAIAVAVAMTSNDKQKEQGKPKNAATRSVAGEVMRSKAGETFADMVQLYFSRRGRLSRGRFWRASLTAWLLFWMAFVLLDGVTGFDFTRIPALLLIGALFSLSSKRYHDLDRSSLWLLLLLIPVFGVLVVFYELGFRRGSVGENSFGSDPRDLKSLDRDYATVS